MKIIENKNTNIPLNKDESAKYSDLLFVAINRPLPEAILLSDMRKHLRLITAIEDAKQSDTIEILDEDFPLLLSRVETSTWNIVSPDLIEFADYIESFK